MLCSALLCSHTVLCGVLYAACVDASRTVFWDRSHLSITIVLLLKVLHILFHTFILLGFYKRYFSRAFRVSLCTAKTEQDTSVSSFRVST